MNIMVLKNRIFDALSISFTRSLVLNTILGEVLSEKEIFGSASNVISEGR